MKELFPSPVTTKLSKMGMPFSELQISQDPVFSLSTLSHCPRMGKDFTARLVSGQPLAEMLYRRMSAHLDGSHVSLVAGTVRLVSKVLWNMK